MITRRIVQRSGVLLGTALCLLLAPIALCRPAFGGTLPELLYVAEPSANAVEIYGLTGGKPIGSIPFTPGSQIAVSADQSGGVYVSDYAAGTVAVYPYGATTPSLIIPVATASGVCVDSHDTVYVSTYLQAVYVFPKGQTTPIEVLNNPSSSYAEGSGMCALDRRDTLSVIFGFAIRGFSGSIIGKFTASGIKTPIFFNQANFDDVAVDGEGNMLLNDAPHKLRVFPAYGGNSIREFAFSRDGHDQAFAFDRLRMHVFVNSTAHPKEIEDFAYTSGALLRTIRIDAPAGMLAVSPGPG